MKVIEFFGMPRSGKTTQVRMLIEEFKQKEVNYKIFPKKRITVKNLEELNMMLYESLTAYYEKTKTKNTDYLVYDRGFYDRLALSTADYQRGKVSERFKESLTEKLEEKLEKVDFPILCLIDPKTSLERRKKQGRKRISNYIITDTILPKDFNWLQQLFEVYINIKEKYPGIHILNSEIKKEDFHQNILEIISM